MIEIHETPDNNWRWTLIGSSGAVLYSGVAGTQKEAFYAARDTRARVWRNAVDVDHRQGCR
jgi:hypothetical protein